MRAVVKETPAPGAVLRDVAMPVCAAGEVLLKVKATAICGTDIHIYDWNPWAAGAGIPLPGVMGHECSAEVVEIGAVGRKGIARRAALGRQHFQEGLDVMGAGHG